MHFSSRPDFLGVTHSKNFGIQELSQTSGGSALFRFTEFGVSAFQQIAHPRTDAQRCGPLNLRIVYNFLKVFDTSVQPKSYFPMGFPRDSAGPEYAEIMLKKESWTRKGARVGKLRGCQAQSGWLKLLGYCSFALVARHPAPLPR